MGYYIEIIDSEFFIAAENKPLALQALQDLPTDMGGGGNGNIRCFSWVDANFRQAHSLEDCLNAWRWGADTDNVGNITGIWFKNEKLGDEEFLFNAIAPFVQSGSYIEVHGEEGARWRWVFENGKCTEKWATITWE